jgi:hypothetical protein
MALTQEFIVAAQLDCQFPMLIVDLAGNKLLRRIYDSLQLLHTSQSPCIVHLVVLRLLPISTKPLLMSSEHITWKLPVR